MPISSSGLCAASASATDCCSNCSISSCGIKLVKSTKSGPSFPAFLQLYLRIGKKKSHETTMSPMSVWFNATSLGELGEEIHGPTLRSKSSNCKASAKAVASVRGHRRREWWVTRYCIVPTLGDVQYTPREPTISLQNWWVHVITSPCRYIQKIGNNIEQRKLSTRCVFHQEYKWKARIQQAIMIHDDVEEIYRNLWQVYWRRWW